MSTGGAYNKILDNLTFLKNKESLDVLDETIDYVTRNNLSFIEGFLHFTEAQVEKKNINITNHSVKMAGFPRVKTLEEFDFEYQPSINRSQIEELNSLRFIDNSNFNFLSYLVVWLFRTIF